ncbi:hypothetical protein HCU64_07035 [Methylobacterium sp. C25]|uniref:GCG_CRPN prefix-to-repeats domain-containing protein n=1 Tax=Methylobacterium sp. C25 TaxID=2721622 RepID=UPI001F274732|nr:hypothetical protein [Methylobacterium sp. C25]MCE4223501.1 hypothetical protein [Methylobacterium sp. C25]
MRSTWIAAPLVALGLLGASAGIAEARDGCGPGFHRTPWGVCRPNAWGPRFYGPGVWGRPHYGWHRWGGWGGPRRFGWHGGWHRGGWHHRW